MLLIRMQHHGLCQRMLASGFQRRREGQQFIFGNAPGRQDIGDAGFAGGDGAGLIQRHNIGSAGFFQRNGGFEQYAVLRTHAAAHHDGYGRCKAQRAGTADDQYGNGAREGIAGGLAHDHPDDEGDQCNGDDGGHEYAGNPVRNLGDGGLGGGSIGNHPDNLGQGGILAHAGGLAADEAGLVDGGGGDGIARSLIHGDGFAGERGFVHRRLTLQHHAVHGNALTRANHKDIALLHLRNGHRLLRAVLQDGGHLRRKIHQGFQRIGGAALGAGFQHLAHGDQRQDHACGFKIQAVEPVHGPGRIGGHGEELVGTVAKGRCRAHCHQRIHIGRAMQQALEAADKEFLVDHHDGGRQQQLRKRHGNGITLKKAGQRPAPHGMAHGYIHQHDQEAQRRKQALLQHGRRPVLERGCIVCRSGGGFSALFACAVAGALNCRDDLLRICTAFHAHGIGQQAHRAGSHARQLGNRLFNTGAACGAAHAGNIVLFHRNSFLGRERKGTLSP